MKKILILAVVFLSVFTNADLTERNWISLSTYANPPYFYEYPYDLPPVPMYFSKPYDGYGWEVAIALSGSHFIESPLVRHAGTHVNYGWYDGYGIWLGEFNFTAYEGEEIVMRIYNAKDYYTATTYCDSLPILLPDLGGEINPEDLKLNFTFIPEPSTMGLICIGGLGCFLARRKAHP